MRTTRQLSVTVPVEMADMIRTEVSSGEYASESEVIRDGLRALAARHKAVESWLCRDVAPAYDAMKVNSERRLSTKSVKAALAKNFKRHSKRR